MHSESLNGVDGAFAEELLGVVAHDVIAARMELYFFCWSEVNGVEGGGFEDGEKSRKGVLRGAGGLSEALSRVAG